eukprot:TRINITY_DN90831_c0_g1_i1.p1 TRINITY_DN90831_c0_g1~~TRINITY_DN90831_c0_g1_i1.p1  ORF type:complete len:431 (+),score=59.59 TRINITY_DN90831_c0_g1_i1:43-1335(+)
MAAAVRREVAVVGGGFVGLSCALHLQRAGHAVTLVDRTAPGAPEQASFGNAGTFAKYANIPVNKTGIALELPGMLMNPDGPLAIKCSTHLPRMLPWGLRFLAACRPQRVEQISRSLDELMVHAEKGWEPAWEQAGVDIDKFRVRNGCLYLYGSEKSFEASEAEVRTRERVCKVERLRPNEIAELEPKVDRCYAGGLFFDAWHVRDPGALVAELAQGFQALGGQVVRQHAKSIVARQGVSLEDGSLISAESVVVAAGAYSKPLAESVGDFIPLDTERGYHVTFSGHENLVSRPVGWAEGGFYMTPMSNWLRVAGTVELGGLNAGMTTSRCEMLEREAQKLLPSLPAKRDAGKDWLGFRPTLPDSLPVIGCSPSAPGVVYAFGHQHVGFTLGGITGQLVAELVGGMTPSIDLHPFRAGRFGEYIAGEQTRWL